MGKVKDLVEIVIGVEPGNLEEKWDDFLGSFSVEAFGKGLRSVDFRVRGSKVYSFAPAYLLAVGGRGKPEADPEPEPEPDLFNEWLGICDEAAKVLRPEQFQRWMFMVQVGSTPEEYVELGRRALERLRPKGPTISWNVQVCPYMPQGEVRLTTQTCTCNLAGFRTCPVHGQIK